MTQITAYIQQLQKLEKTIFYLDFTREPITPQQIEQLEQLHSIQLNPELKEILLTVGCTYWGFQDMDWEWIGLANIACRQDYTDEVRQQIVAESFVFSDDGAGNPIMINNRGVMHIFYHDDEGYEQLAETIPVMMKKFIGDLQQ